MKPKLSIIIVHYHLKDILFKCLASIKKNPPKCAYEIIVVDNDEKKSLQPVLKKKFKQARYIKSSGNIGYGAGNNLGAKQARGKYLLILNPDTQLLPHSIDLLTQFLDTHSKAGVVAPLLTNSKGKVYPLQGTTRLTPLKAVFALSFINNFWPNNPVSRSYWKQADKLDQPTLVHTVPGSALLIRHSLFKKINGFDENFFLYFEETDLCHRVGELNSKIYLLPDSIIIHHWAGVTPQSSKIKKIFSKSRYYYFKKNFSSLSALVVEFFARLSPYYLGLFTIFTLATWLRFYQLPQFMSFIGDQGRDYLAARDMLINKKLPLVGIPSSVPWLHQGVFFIWMTALALKLANFNPVGPAVMTALIGVLTVYLITKVTKGWFNNSTSLLAGLIAATSPLMVAHSRIAYHTSPIPLFSILYLESLYLSIKGKISYFWPILLWSTLLQFELTTLPLILILPILSWSKLKTTSVKSRLTYLFAILTPFLPKIIYDFTHGFKQTLGFIAWGGYRFLSFFGFSGRHTVSLESLDQVTKTIFAYWQKFSLYNSPSFALLSILIVIFGLIKLTQSKKSFTLPIKLLLAFISITYLSFYLHQAPSEAYFPVLFPAWTILFAWAVNYFKSYALKSLIIVLALYNSIFLVTHQFLPYGPTLSEQVSLVRLIQSQSSSKKINLVNPPVVSQYPSHLDNYRYLLWYLGSETELEGEQAYTIYDQPLEKFTPQPNQNNYYFDHSILIKHE